MTRSSHTLACVVPQFLNAALCAAQHMKAIHSELAGGRAMLSNNYYIEKHGPCAGGGLHHGGFPRMRNFHYGYDHTTTKFDCFSTKSTIILTGRRKTSAYRAHSAHATAHRGLLNWVCLVWRHGTDMSTIEKVQLPSAPPSLPAARDVQSAGPGRS
jgi:hypothetical protein